MKTRFGLWTAVLAVVIAGLPLAARAGEGRVILGGGQTTFGTDLDGDGDIDGAYFGIGVQIQDQVVTGHFVCAMWGNTEYLKLPLMAVEGQIETATLNDKSLVATFKGRGTVDLGKGQEGLMTGVPFEVTLKAGGPGAGKIQLTVIGVLDGVPGDLIIGNDNCDLPLETITSGLIEVKPLAPTLATIEGGRALTGGGQTTFSTDLDGDGDIDGAYFGVGVEIQDQAVSGHFVCAMWGNTEYLKLPLMAVEGQVNSVTLSSKAEVLTFRGMGTVDLGKGREGLMTGVPFEVTLKAGGPGAGKIQLTVIGVLDGVPGDLIIGNDNCDLPLETITSGLVEIHALPSLATAVEEEMSRTPAAFVLKQNYPNPFNPETTIHYEVAEESEVRLSILDLAGQELRMLAQGMHQPGQYSAVWDGKDDSGRAVASGVYLYRLEVEGRGVIETKRMALVR